MKLSTGVYTDWTAIVNKLSGTPPVPASVVAFYRVDTSVGRVVEVWALFDAWPLMVYGLFNNNGPLTAAFTAVYTGAVQVTTSIGETES